LGTALFCVGHKRQRTAWSYRRPCPSGGGRRELRFRATPP
jgi:hypothetical protein